MDKLFITILILFFSTVSANHEEMLRKGFTYSEKFQAYYMYSDKLGLYSHFSFISSNVICSKEGARLFYPQSEEEAKFAFQLVPKNESEIWIGAAGSSNDNWSKLHGVEGDTEYLQTITNLENIPEDSGVVMKRPMEYKFAPWNTWLPYICKKNKDIPQLSEKRLRQLITDGYIYNATFKALYKHTNQKKHYSFELMWCNFDGGTSFLPKSREEALIPQDMKITGLTNIGIIKPDDSDFISVEGKNISNTYVDWAQDEPKPQHNLIAIDNSGKYYSVLAENPNEYICKITLPECFDPIILEPKSYSDIDSQMFIPITDEDPQKFKFFEPLKTIFPSGERTSLNNELEAKNYKYIGEYESYYKVHSESAHSQWTAALICSSDSSDLFYPESDEEARDIYDLIPLHVNKIWVGIMVTPAGKLHSFTGETVSTVNYATIFQNVTKQGMTLLRFLNYESAHYKEKYTFVCKKYIRERSRTTDIEKQFIMANGYYFHSEYDAWYKYYASPQSFKFAFVQCLIDGAILFAPETYSELERLLRLAFFSLKITDPIWLGMTKFLRNHFVTVKGKLASGFYYNWAQNQPDSRYDFVIFNQTAGFYAGTYYTTQNCNKHSFICKKPRRH